MYNEEMRSRNRRSSNNVLRISTIGKKADKETLEIFEKLGMVPDAIFEEGRIGNFNLTTYRFDGEPRDNVAASQAMKMAIKDCQGIQLAYRHGDWMKILVLDDF